MNAQQAQRTLLKGAGFAGMAEAVTRITRIVTAIALARMMSVEEFGIAAAALSVHELTRMFIQNGLGTRIVAASDAELAEVAGSVYWMNMVLGVVLFVVQVAISVPAASYFGTDALIPAIIALAAVHLIYPFSMVQVYLAQRQNRWGLISGTTAALSAADNLMMAVLAIAGFGIWAVVLPKIAVAVIWTVWHYRATPWQSRAPFEFKVARKLLAYASTVLGTELLTALRMHGDKVVIGAALGPVALGLYAFASNIGNGITTSLSQSLGAVLLPFLRSNNASGTLRVSYLKSLGLLSAMTLPLVILQAGLAHWYVGPVFGDKWVPAIPLLILLSVASLTRPVFVATSQMLRAKHDTATDLWLAALSTVLFFAGLGAGLATGGVYEAALLSSLGLFAGSVLALVTGVRATRQQDPQPAAAVSATAAAVSATAAAVSPTAPPRVSVVIACFNAERTIGETLASVRAQTLPDFEILVVDDGSRDGSRAIVQALALEEPRLRLIAQTNAGPSAARNRGVAEARAPIVAFLDADDLWDPVHLALNVAALDRDPRLGVSFGGARYISGDGTLNGRRSRLWVGGVTQRDVLACNPTATCSSLVIRKDVFAGAGLLRGDMRFAEDQEWLFRVLTAGWAIRSLARHTLAYRTSEGGLSAQIDKMAEGWRQFIALATAAAPERVGRDLPRATAHMELYFADRVLAAHGPVSRAARHVATAVRAWPPIVADAPKRVIRILLTTLQAALKGAFTRFMRKSATCLHTPQP